VGRVSHGVAFARFYNKKEILMLKSYIFASALSLFMAGTAAAAAVSVTITLGGSDYEVIELYGSFEDHEAQLLATPWWAGEFDAFTAAQASYDAGFPEDPGFAYRVAFKPDHLVFYHDFDTVPGGASWTSPTWVRSWAAVAPVTAVPVPAAGWLFMSALIGLMGKKRLSRRSVH
jgi:hypothetical protein